ncbi:hypothetical protein [Streptomyces sp. URMC 125]|uniref:hypothetical protein n=1 Tax=Streptomyces sp. URMC 125 TaxID=3423419 RepID=UPI003F1D8160
MNGETTTESVTPAPTPGAEPAADRDPPPGWEWLPRAGHSLRLAGVHFDAVRVAGELAEEAARETDGPVVREHAGERYTYFLLPPGTVRAYRWPPGARGLTSGDRYASYVGVPALRGVTWPLSWRRTPTGRAPFVEPAALHRLLCRLTGPRPLPAAPTAPATEGGGR